MVKVNFQPNNLSIEVEAGTTILEAARRAGVVIESPCNAVGTCGKCKVKVDSQSLGRIMQKGEHHLSWEEEDPGYVLSCQAYLQGDVNVEIIKREKNKTLKILNAGKSLALEIDSYLKKEFSQAENITKVYAGEELLAVEEGDTEKANYGVVVDIGTTTVVTSLVDVNTGEELASTSALNPQSLHAQDVLSRIKFASEEKGLETMSAQLIQELNRMIGEISQEAGIKQENIYEVIFSGNTCMLHLAAKVSPYSLGKYPYTPEVVGGVHLSAAEHDLQIAPQGLIYLPPIISAYVGADITSGILAAKLHEQKGTTLFVDIGTNGEMVIGVDGKLSAASTAAGPAFEGMNITYGMRAGAGAIELFNVEEDGSITIETIGDTQAIGICGSGLLDIVGELVAHGVIDKTGRFVESQDLLTALKNRLIEHDGKLVFRLTEKVFLSQKDIRQVQLAKGAIRAGIEFLLQVHGIEASKVDKVLIAGSFGYHLRAKSLINIGLLPEEFSGKIEFMGNTSKSGGQAFLVNQKYRSEMEKIVGDIRILELANYPGFDKVFINCLNF